MAAELTILTGADERDLTKLDEYRAIGGYAQLEKAREMSPEQLIETISNAKFRGRGGAGFAMGRKRASSHRRTSAVAPLGRGERRRVRAGGFQGPRVMGESRTGSSRAV